jgi:hypothetical protein
VQLLVATAFSSKLEIIKGENYSGASISVCCLKEEKQSNASLGGNGS